MSELDEQDGTDKAQREVDSLTVIGPKLLPGCGCFESLPLEPWTPMKRDEVET